MSGLTGIILNASKRNIPKKRKNKHTKYYISKSVKKAKNVMNREYKKLKTGVGSWQSYSDARKL